MRRPRSVGAKVTLTAEAIEGFRINANYGLNFAEFTDFMGPAPDDFTGNTLPNVPRHTFSTPAEYEHPSDEGISAAGVFVCSAFSLRFSATARSSHPPTKGWPNGQTSEAQSALESADPHDGRSRPDRGAKSV